MPGCCKPARGLGAGQEGGARSAPSAPARLTSFERRRRVVGAGAACVGQEDRALRALADRAAAGASRPTVLPARSRRRHRARPFRRGLAAAPAPERAGRRPARAARRPGRRRSARWPALRAARRAGRRGSVGTCAEHGRVGDHHRAGDPAQQHAAQRDDHREAVHQLDHELAAPDDDRDANQQAEDHQRHLVVAAGALGGAGDGDDVVHAHHEVGDDDRLDGRPAACRWPAMLPWPSSSLGHQQLDADPDQQHRADELQERDRQQRQREEDQHHAQHDGAGGAPQDALACAAFGGSLRQASAMTTALSPPSRMSIMMIWPTAIQNSAS